MAGNMIFERSFIHLQTKRRHVTVASVVYKWVFHHSYNIWCVFQIYCKQNIMGPEPQPSLVCRLALLTYLPVLDSCNINERHLPLSGVARRIIITAYFIWLTPHMLYKLINKQWKAILYLYRVNHHINWGLSPQQPITALWPRKDSLYA